MTVATRLPQDRFEEKFEPVTESGCWIWTAHCLNKGYGLFYFSGRPELAHRVAYELYVGPIPDGEGYHGTCVLHKCDLPSCVNPDHLFLGTNTDNIADMCAKGRHHNGLKTHCKRGHEFTPKNTYINPRSGKRCCNKCRSVRKKAQKYK